MAIIIPSKNIYEISNPKIIDNAIDKISVNKTIVKPDNDYKVSVFNEDYQIEAKISEENTQTEYSDAYALNQGGGTQRNVRGACGLRYKIEYFKIPTILIPKVKNNKVINKIYSGVDDDGNDEIKISIKATQQLYTGSTSYQPSSNRFYFDDVSLTLKEEKDLFGNLADIADIEIENDVTSDVNSMFVTQPYSLKSTHSLTNNKNELKISSYLYVNSNNNWQPAIIELDVNKSKNVGNGSVDISEEIIDGVEYYKLTSIKFFVGADVYMASCLFESTGNISSIEGYIRSVATRYVIKPEQISITVYGNTIGISLNEANKSYGDGNKPYSIDGNELLQDSGKVGDNNLPEYLASNILQQYRTGKETATLLCDISDYYDNNGEKEISITTRNYFKDVANSNTEIVNTNGLYQVPSNLPIAWYNNIGVVHLKAGTYTASAIPNGNKFYGRYQLNNYPTYNDTDNLVNTVIGQTAQFTLLEDKDVYLHFCSDNIYNSADPRPAFSFKFEIIGISDRLTFKHYDEVVPMIRNATGFDVPMSLTKNGNGKIFTVLGNHIFYDGAVWQEINLQESGEFIDFGNGTVGLEYVLSNDKTHYICKSVGTAKVENIIISNLISGTPVTEIADQAFMQNGLVTIKIPNTITRIGTDAFYGCQNIESVYVSDLYSWFNIEFENDYANPLRHGKLYVNGVYSAIIKIPETINTIRSYVLNGYEYLESVIVPVSVVSIEEDAFASNNIIYYEGNETQWNAINKSENWGDSYVYYYSEQSLGGNYWHYVNGVPTLWEETDFILALNEDGSSYTILDVKDKTKTELTIPLTYDNKPIRKIKLIDSGEVRRIVVTDNVVEIEADAFYSCGNLESLYFGAGITSNITSSFLEGCWQLKDIEVYGGNPAYRSENGVVYSKNGRTLVCYPRGKTETSFAIPNYVTTIGESAFYGCENLKQVTIPTSVTTIGQSAFYMCTALESINIPSGVTEIPPYAFYGCNLKQVTIPNSVTTIGEYAFYNCPIESITIPSSVTTIPSYAFSDCYELQQVTMTYKTSIVQVYAFNNCYLLNKVVFHGTPDQWESLTIDDEYLFNAYVEFIE